MITLKNPTFGVSFQQLPDDEGHQTTLELHGETGEKVTLIFDDDTQLYNASYGFGQIANRMTYMQEFGFEAMTEHYEMEEDDDDDTSDDLWNELKGG